MVEQTKVMYTCSEGEGRFGLFLRWKDDEKQIALIKNPSLDIEEVHISKIEKLTSQS